MDVNVNANGGGGNDKLTSNADPLTPIVRRHDLSGGPGSDELTISSGGATLDGGPGNDKLTGGDRGDTFLAYEVTDGDDVIDGAGGSDTVAYGDSSGGFGPATIGENGRGGTVDVVLNGATPTTGNGAGAEKDSIVNVENVTGGFGNDNMTGDALVNLLLGGPGNDTLNGAGGPDSIVGHTGVDNLFGGPGSDQLQAREADFSKPSYAAGDGMLNCGLDGGDSLVDDIPDPDAAGCEFVAPLVDPNPLQLQAPRARATH